MLDGLDGVDGLNGLSECLSSLVFLGNLRDPNVVRLEDALLELTGRLRMLRIGLKGFAVSMASAVSLNSPIRSSLSSPLRTAASAFVFSYRSTADPEVSLLKASAI